MLKDDIIKWNHRELGNVSCQKKDLLEVLGYLDMLRKENLDSLSHRFMGGVQ